MAVGDLVVGRPRPRVELRPEGAGEDEGIRLADEDSPAYDLERQPVEPGVAEHHAAVVDETAEPIGQSARLVGRRRDEAGQGAGGDDQARVRIDERHARRRLGQRIPRILHRAPDREHPQHSAGPDVRARELLHRLRRRPQGDHEEPRVAVERDELAGGDLPGGGEVRADPRDEHDEEPWQEHLGSVERRLRRGYPDAGEAHALGALPVTVEEGLLAPDSAQHAEARSGVGAERGQEAHLLALLPLPELERLDHEAERDREQRHPDQHEEAERDRGRQQDGGDDEVRDDAADEPREDLECPTRSQRVIRDGRNDLSGREAAPVPRLPNWPHGDRRPERAGTMPAASSARRSGGASLPPRPARRRARRAGRRSARARRRSPSTTPCWIAWPIA